MRKLKLALFTGTVIGTIGGLGLAVYHIEQNKENKEGFRIKGVFDTQYLSIFKNFKQKKDAGVAKENIYFNYEVPFKNKSIKNNENKIFNIGTQSELLIALATFKLIEETKDKVEDQKIKFDDRLNKWFSTSTGTADDKKVAEILNGNALKKDKIASYGLRPFNYLTDIKIYHLLLNTSTLPNFNNLKTKITKMIDGKEKNIAEEIKKQYYKNPIVAHDNTNFIKNRTKWKLLDFINLAASKWIDKDINNLYDNPYNANAVTSPINNQQGPLNINPLDKVESEDKDKDNFREWEHSPLNYILLANILEKVYKKAFDQTWTFDQIVKKYVLEPLKMNNTYYNIQRIDKFKDKVYKDVDTSFLNASKGYVSTLEDLSKLYNALYKKDSKLLKPATFEDFFKFLYLPENFKQDNYEKRIWPGIGGLKLLVRTFDYQIDLLTDYANKIFFIKGISPDFRSYSFYCKDKEIFFLVASDVPYSYYSTNTNKEQIIKTATELTSLINSTFEFDISNLIDQKET